MSCVAGKSEVRSGKDEAECPRSQFHSGKDTDGQKLTKKLVTNSLINLF